MALLAAEISWLQPLPFRIIIVAAHNLPKMRDFYGKTRACPVLAALLVHISALRLHLWRRIRHRPADEAALCGQSGLAGGTGDAGPDRHRPVGARTHRGQRLHSGGIPCGRSARGRGGHSGHRAAAPYHPLCALPVLLRLQIQSGGGRRAPGHAGRCGRRDRQRCGGHGGQHPLPAGLAGHGHYGGLLCRHLVPGGQRHLDHHALSQSIGILATLFRLRNPGEEEGQV